MNYDLLSQSATQPCTCKHINITLKWHNESRGVHGRHAVEWWKSYSALLSFIICKLLSSAGFVQCLPSFPCQGCSWTTKVLQGEKSGAATGKNNTMKTQTLSNQQAAAQAHASCEAELPDSLDNMTTAFWMSIFLFQWRVCREWPMALAHPLCTVCLRSGSRLCDLPVYWT